MLSLTGRHADPLSRRSFHAGTNIACHGMAWPMLVQLLVQGLFKAAQTTVWIQGSSTVESQPYICHWRYILSIIPPPEDIADLQLGFLSRCSSTWVFMSSLRITRVDQITSVRSDVFRQQLLLVVRSWVLIESMRRDRWKVPEILVLRWDAIQERDCNSHLQEFMKSTAHDCLFFSMSELQFLLKTAMYAYIRHEQEVANLHGAAISENTLLAERKEQ